MHRKTIGGYIEDIFGSPELKATARAFSETHRYIPPETVEIMIEPAQTTQQGEPHGTSN